jgi:hypothetical protein
MARLLFVLCPSGSANMEKRFGTAKLVAMLGPAPRWRVLVGKEATVEGAQRLAATLSADNKDAFVTRLDDKLPNPLRNHHRRL